MKKTLFEKFSGSTPPGNRCVYAMGIAAFAVFFDFVMIGKEVFNHFPAFLKATLLNAAVILTAFRAHLQVDRYIVTYFADAQKILVRVALKICSHALLSGIWTLLFAWLYIGMGLFGAKLTAHTLVTLYVATLIAVVLATGLRESFGAIARWRQHEINTERLMKENVNGQLEGLKAQISPHFLFNTLNSLSALIGEDPEKAEQFVDEMARVYRYLLQTNHSSVDQGDFGQLTTLKKELSFIESYGHLLKTRYGDGMKLYIHVEDCFLDCRIPPLTLQLLVENAVKHNVIRASRPLTIFILSTVEGRLMVRNNLQKKNFTAGVEHIESTHVGLANILTKYKLLSEYRPGLPQPAIERNHEFFTVTLPLIS